MDTAVVVLKTLLPDCLHVLVDDLEVGLGVVPDLDRLCLQFADAALCLQTLLDLLPCAVLVGADLALAVLGAAALAVDQALGAVHDGADTAGHGQVALGAGIASLFRQCHAMVAGVVQGVAGRKNRQLLQIRNGLDTQAAGNHNDIFRALGDQRAELFGSQGLVAQKVHFGSARDGLSLLRGKFHKHVAISFLCGFKGLKTLVASNHKEVVLPRKYGSQFVLCFQLILGIIFQLLTFLTKWFIFFAITVKSIDLLLSIRKT